jgi:hypothetical protein
MLIEKRQRAGAVQNLAATVKLHANSFGSFGQGGKEKRRVIKALCRNLCESRRPP